MVAGLGVLFILVGVVLIVTTYTGTTGQVLESIFGSTPAPTTTRVGGP